MNIFYLSSDPELAAQYHCDKHIVSQIKETAQMLSTCHRFMGYNEGYKSTHVNHPCNLWLRESYANYRWLKSLAFHLHEQWRLRYNHPKTRVHASYEVIVNLSQLFYENIGHTQPALVMPEQYRGDNPIKSYRDFYLNEKRSFAKWRLGAPEWWR